MKAIIFNGALERRSSSTSNLLSRYIKSGLENFGIENHIFDLADSGIPLFDCTLTRIPNGVQVMNNLFREADIHFWLAPLYHGSIPGVMKNCLDWLEVSAKKNNPYLTDKTVALVCWADGVQAMQGINTMDAIAKSLRAWPLPYSVPISKKELFDPNISGEISQTYKDRLNLLINLATTKTITAIPAINQ
ncbi:MULTISPECIES: NADPH-dependent FMN reductase [Sphingobacterium]|jgi:arsenic resistance protein ArsH|uniref:NADPH-dependent FMN reductase n=1 Tax=Sphingobacterium TaxID=28453 RepID=UPI00038A21B6|nr:NADPH-dependent FMN reductase [Sphingobacterium sp. IITKGP-BTPF85]KKX47109.1 NADPH-dependent FMN reductase [Sphingobacterium sp. IITKGP-BTPF85]